MKILHFAGANERNSYNCFKQMKEVYDVSEHTFLISSYDRVVKEQFPLFYSLGNLEFIEEHNFLKKIYKPYKLMKEADVIIFHSLLFNTDKYIIYLYILRKFLKKSVWIEWGGDLYNWRKHSSKLKDKILNYFNKVIRKKVPKVGITFEKDSESVISQFGNKKIYFLPLPFGTDRLELLKTISKETRAHETVTIQVAHNALTINNHFMILERLEKFRYNNIRLVFPLAYGTYGIAGQYGGKIYKNNLIKVANAMFPKKTIVMNKGIPLINYLKYLNSIDIAIFNCERTIALANIYYLYFFGKKIYLPKNSPQYKFLIENNLVVHATEDIANQNFEEFIRNPITPCYNALNDSLNLPNLLYKKFIPYQDIQSWGILFDDLEKEYGNKKD